ncbi:MAG: class I SAM-dependent methyltransferase, partial [Candidatus Thermoplasmatota archaeon]
ILAKVGEEGRVVGIDISLEMCRITQGRLFAENSFQNVDLICADAVCIPLKENIFDKIFMSFTLELFSELEILKVLDEIKRILNEKGKLCVVSLSREEDVFVELYEIFHDLFPRILDCRPIYPKKILEDRNFEVEEVRREKMGILPIQIVTAMSR